MKKALLIIPATGIFYTNPADFSRHSDVICLQCRLLRLQKQTGWQKQFNNVLINERNGQADSRILPNLLVSKGNDKPNRSYNLNSETKKKKRWM